MGRRAKEWWSALTPEKRAELKQRHAAEKARSGRMLHHYRDDLACPVCGTDSTVGCIAEVNHG